MFELCMKRIFTFWKITGKETLTMFETKDNQYNIYRAKNQTTFVFDFDILPKSLTDLNEDHHRSYHRRVFLLPAQASFRCAALVSNSIYLLVPIDLKD